MSKYKNIVDNTYRSNLEKYCAEELLSNEIEFLYEPYQIQLVPKFKSEIISYERVKKKFIPQYPNIRSITYTPDFVGDTWIIEVKGMKTPDFNIKWKMFKKHLAENELRYTLFMPHNKKEIRESIRIIKDEKDSQRNMESNPTEN